MEWTAENISRILDKPGKGKRRKSYKGYMVCCPAHDDSTPSLHLIDGQKGLVWYCHAGCDQQEVLTALKSITNSDYSLPVPKSRKKIQKSVIEDKFKLHIPSYDEVRSLNKESFRHFKLGLPSKVWKYNNSDGIPILYIARYETEDGKEIIPWSWHSKNGAEPTFMMKNIEDRRPLYNLEKIEKSKGQPILYVEGEKAADAAAELFPNYIITTHAGGGNSYLKTDMLPLIGKTVIILPDNDAPGKKMAENLWLYLKGKAKKCLIMEFPILWPDGSIFEQRQGDDCYDYKAKGWTYEKLVEAKEKGYLSFYIPDPVAQFGEGNPGRQWAKVDASNGKLSIIWRDRVIASCDAKKWQYCADIVEEEINKRIKKFAPRVEDGRFPRFNGYCYLPYAFVGELYSLIESLDRSEDIEQDFYLWQNMHTYMRSQAFGILVKQIEKEDKCYG